MTNDYKICGEVTAIYLHRRNGDIEECLIDTADLPVAQSIWGTWGAATDKRHGVTYVRFCDCHHKPKTKIIPLHRLIMDAPMRLEVDHKNHNGLDNRRHNLRLATVSQNQHNRLGPSRRSTNGFRGVSFEASSKKNPWKATTRIEGKDHYLGLYPTPKAAHEALVKFRKEKGLYEHTGN